MRDSHTASITNTAAPGNGKRLPIGGVSAVARKVKVSRSLVSKIVNRRQHFAAKATVARVWAAVRELTC